MIKSTLVNTVYSYFSDNKVDFKGYIEEFKLR